jgi:hypothetical protein
VVGVDRYLNPRVNPLRGCVADALDMQDLLVDAYGLDPAEVRVLTNEQATSGLILAGFHWLLRGSEDEAPRVFYDASHGSLVPDIDGDEGPGDCSDGLICPHDWDPADPIRTGIVDDDVSRILRSLPDSAVVSFVIDACYSGEMARDAGPFSERFAPSAFQRAASERDSVVSGRPNPISMEGIVADVVFLSACDPYQTAKEVFDGSGRARGAMTMALTAVQRADIRIGCRATKLAIGGILAARKLSQTPQLVGSRRRRDGGIFGLSELL